MKSKYVIGIDFGSDSARAIIADVSDGRLVGEGEYRYPRWMQGKYQDAEIAKFRQHPLDHIEAMEISIKKAMESMDAESRDDIIALSVATTGSTPCPVNSSGVPLALLEEFSDNANAMFHLWKDHTALFEAEEINRAFSDYNGTDYTKFQGIYSAEWYWAKILHTIRVDQAVKEAAITWVELCDWIPALLTGNTDPKSLYRCSCAAGHKAYWHSEWGGLPSSDCLGRIDPYLKKIAQNYGIPRPADRRVGMISEEWARRLDLPKDTIIGGSSFDAHAGAVGAGIKPNILVSAVGTSAVDMMVEKRELLNDKPLSGLCGQAEDSILPAYVGIETGQAAFGDIYNWFKNLLMWPAKEILRKQKQLSGDMVESIIQNLDKDILRVLDETAQELDLNNVPIALDWFNGRRYPYEDGRLRGTISGLSLGTDTPAFYQSLVMATVFGKKRIIDGLAVAGLMIDKIITVGGIARKSEYIMQMMADVMNCPILVSGSRQAAARGAAIYAAVSAGVFTDIQNAQEVMCEDFIMTYEPSIEKNQQYLPLYKRYCSLAECGETLAAEWR